MNLGELDAPALLARLAQEIPPALRANVVVIGSIAAAWAFRDVSGTGSVATKDIDLLLRPAARAISTAKEIGQELLDDRWKPHYPQNYQAGDAHTRDDALPALRLTPPGDEDGWFVELLGEPPPEQATRKHWRRFTLAAGDFGLPSFRYLPVAAHGAEETGFGLRVATPACMALAHLLEHAEPDRTPISSLPGQPPRFAKDVGRAVALWWLAQEQAPMADATWLRQWHAAVAQAGIVRTDAGVAAREGLASLAGYLREAHAIALHSILAPHATTLDAYRRAYEHLGALVERFQSM